MILQNPLSLGSFLQEGAAPIDELLLLACTIGDDPDEPENELVLATEVNALRVRASNEAFVSVDSDPDGTGYVMGEWGTVIRFRWKNVESEQTLKASRTLVPNPSVAGLGPMRRIRVIDGTVVCVGSFGQIYTLQDTEWVPFPFVNIYSDDVTLKDIAGTSLKDMVAVSQHGVAARYDGRTWIDLHLPSNMKMSSVTSLASGQYAIAGSGKNLFIGAVDQWRQVTAEDSSRDYYGVAAQRDLIYVAHIAGIDVFDGGGLKEVSYDDKSNLEFAFLRGGEKHVWSFSGSTIGRIQGREWITLLRPTS